MENKKMKFIRKNGRIIPIRAGGKSKESSRKKRGKKSKVKGLSENAKRVLSVGGVVAGSITGRSLVEKMLGGAIGGLIGTSLGSVKFAKRKKGESNKDLAKRVGSSV